MRKTKYDTNVAPFLEEIEQMARNGATDKEIASNLKVAYSTFRKYRAEHEELANRLMTSKMLADLNIEAALFKRARGGVVEVNKPIKLKKTDYNENGKRIEYEEVEIFPEEIYVPPDTRAAMFYLKNRKTEEWKDRQYESNINTEVEDITALVELLK